MRSALTEIHGVADAALAAELALAAVFLLLHAALSFYRAGFKCTFVTCKREIVSAGMISLFFFILAYSQWWSSGRPVLAIHIALPGTLVTRTLHVDIPLWQRRFFEPALWFVQVLLLTASFDVRTKAGSRWFMSAALALFFSHMLQVFWLTLGRTGEPPPFVLVAADGFGAQAFVLSVVVAAGLEIQHLLMKSSPEGQMPGAEHDDARFFTLTPGRFASWLLLVPSFAIFLCLSGTYFARRHPLQVGAHYYSWFPENWRAGYIGGKLVPPILPALGEYRSDEPETFEQHVKWAKEAGISFLVMDWWMKRGEVQRRIDTFLSEKSNIAGLAFALMYETSDLKSWGDQAPLNEEASVIYLSKERGERLAKHWTYLVNHFMRRDGYLHIGGRPVLFIYATRHLVGPVSEEVRRARAIVHERTGIDVFLVADEAYFNVLRFSERHGILLLPEAVPEWDRLSAFDAITVYNPYDGSRAQHAGEAGAGLLLKDAAKLYQEYRRTAATLGMIFIPGVIPGYNDRGVRLSENHFVVPRYFRGDTEHSFFSEGLKELVQPALDKSNPIFTVTSWNEWNEGTQIEPSVETPGGREDVSGDARAYTQGVLNFGYGIQHLRELSSFVKAEAKTLDHTN